MTRGGSTYVLMVTTSKVLKPMLAPATQQGAIEAACSFEDFPAAVSDDVEALRERARKMREKFTTIESWNTIEVPMIGGIDRDALLALADKMQNQQYMREDARWLRWDEAARLIRKAIGEETK